MLPAEEQAQLEALRHQVDCHRNFCCLYSNIENLCKGRYDAGTDVLECLEPGKPVCSFAASSGTSLVCSCPLRRFIGKHFDQWTAQSTSLLRPPRN